MWHGHIIATMPINPAGPETVPDTVMGREATMENMRLDKVLISADSHFTEDPELRLHLGQRGAVKIAC